MVQFCRLLAVFILGVAIVALAQPYGGSRAWSFEDSATRPVHPRPVADDVCRPLLMIQQSAPVKGLLLQKVSLTDNGGAGAAAAALLLGAHSAVGPREGTAAYLAFAAAGADNSRALAVARYRHCRSQQAIQSLASN